MTSVNIWQLITNRVKAFYQQNRNIYNYIGIGVVLIIGLLIFWKYYWFPDRQHESAVKLARLQHYMSTDSFSVVVNGIKGKKMATAPEIADEYSWTKSGNEAALMAGVCYLQLGKWDKSLKYLDKAEAGDAILPSVILGMKATCYANMDKVDKAAETYEKAANLGDNNYTVDYYIKAGKCYEHVGDYKSALRCYEKVKSNHSTAEVATDIDKYIYKAKGLLGELNN